MFEFGTSLAIICATFCVYYGNAAGVIFCLYLHAYLVFIEYLRAKYK